MQLFTKTTKPVFLKNDSDLNRQLEQLVSLRETAPYEILEKIDKDILILKAGIAGEKNIEYELSQASYSMAILHDLYLTHDNNSAQIDYLIVTRGCIFIIESKNLIGEISVNHKGEFTRKLNIGNRFYQEGIYSPITQNKRHMDLLKEIIVSRQSNILRKSLVSNNFQTFYKSLVVFANPKCAVNDRYAPKEIKNQLIKADRLVAYMHEINSRLSSLDISSEKEMMVNAEALLKMHQDNPVDYTSKYQALIEEYKNREPVCPVCGAPMIRRTARKGPHAGKEFYGCSRYPQCKGIRSI